MKRRAQVAVGDPYPFQAAHPGVSTTSERVAVWDPYWQYSEWHGPAVRGRFGNGRDQS